MRMKRVRARGIRHELAACKLLFAISFRYRTHYKPKSLAIGREHIDVVFPRIKLVVLIGGCIWQGCPEGPRLPKANGECWAEKLEGNRVWNERVTGAPKAERWTVLPFWTHDLLRDIAEAIQCAMKQLKN